jgi:acetyl-CoA C-acetyltransferase
LREAVICSPVRTPIGRYGGALKNVDVTELGELAVRATLERGGLEGGEVDDVIFGQCYPNGEAPALGRIAGLQAGLPEKVGGFQIDRRCGSSLQAICTAMMQVQTGVSDVVVAGGAESMSQAEVYMLGKDREGVDSPELLDRLARARVTAGGRDHPVPGGMVETAENVAREYGITREEQDALALESQRRAVAATDGGIFDAELVPVPYVDDEGNAQVLSHDEAPRRNTDSAALAKLRPVMGKTREDATVTAGNACGQSDGGAACIVTTRELADSYGLEPFGRIVGWAAAGVPPKLMGIGPVPATERVMKMVGSDVGEMEVIELNEAFAAQVLAVTRDWGFGEADFERMNVHGSGIALGHPVGATGCRLLTTLLYALRRRAASRGLVTMCIGGGQGMAAVVERVA